MKNPIFNFRFSTRFLLVLTSIVAISCYCAVLIFSKTIVTRKGLNSVISHGGDVHWTKDGAVMEFYFNLPISHPYYQFVGKWSPETPSFADQFVFGVDAFRISFNDANISETTFCEYRSTIPIIAEFNRCSFSESNECVFPQNARWIRIDNCLLSERRNLELAGLKSLEWIEIGSEVHYKQSGLEKLANSNTIRVIVLRDIEMNDGDLSSIAGLRSLRKLSLFHCSGIDTDEWKNAIQSSSLTDIDTIVCGLKESDFISIRNMRPDIAWQNIEYAGQ